jgi:hypothetical protein
MNGTAGIISNNYISNILCRFYTLNLDTRHMN